VIGLSRKLDRALREEHFGARLLLKIFEKKRPNGLGFAREYLRSCSGYGPGRTVKRRGKSSSLTRK